MSELLQQAIIDATALKEAAIKNAENTLIEKYSQEFKDTVQRLLEQEQVAPAIDSAADATANATPESSAMTEPQADLSSEPQQNGGGAFDNVPSSFLDGDENEMITINFDQIKNTMMEMLGHSESLEEVDMTSAHETTHMDAVAPGAPNDSKNELDEDFELELEGWGEMEEETSSGGAVEAVEALEEVDLDEGAAVQAATANLTGVKAKMGKEEAAAQQKLQAAQDQEAKAEAKAEAEAEKSAQVAEEIAITEEELMELAERLAVDIKVGNMGRGYMGSTKTETKLQREAELAAARDDKAAAERQEEMKKMGDLVKENTELKATTSKLVEAVEMLKEQLEKINVSNAKLLYTNKALGNISLNERQKSQIVESISKADSVLGAKTIYEALQNAVESTKKEKTVPQSLHEAINRAQSPFVVKKSSANSINDVMAERMKALAGIKPNK